MVADVLIEVLHLRHFNQFGNDFSTVENYGFIVHMGGLKVFHVGDVRYSPATFSPFGLDEEGIDVVIIPAFNTLLSPTNASVINSFVAPANVLALHFQTAATNNEAAQARSIFGADTFTTPLEFIRY